MKRKGGKGEKDNFRRRKGQPPAIIPGKHSQLNSEKKDQKSLVARNIGPGCKMIVVVTPGAEMDRDEMLELIRKHKTLP